MLSVAAAVTLQDQRATRMTKKHDLGGRLLLSIAVGVITAWFVLTLAERPNVHTDFEVLWRRRDCGAVG